MPGASRWLDADAAGGATKPGAVTRSAATTLQTIFRSRFCSSIRPSFCLWAPYEDRARFGFRRGGDNLGAADPMSSVSDAGDRALVLRIERRDSDALAALYDRYSARLMGLALRIVADATEAEEVLQDVFLQVWRAAGSYDASRGPVLAWLLVLTRSRAIDRVRARRPSARAGLRRLDDVAEPRSSEDVEAGSATREWEALCRAAIAELPPDQHRALELAYFEG